MERLSIALGEHFSALEPVKIMILLRAIDFWGLLENAEKEKIEKENVEKRKTKYPYMEVFFFFFRRFPFWRFPPNPIFVVEK